MGGASNMTVKVGQYVEVTDGARQGERGTVVGTTKSLARVYINGLRAVVPIQSLKVINGPSANGK